MSTDTESIICIPLRDGGFVIVDAADAQLVERHRWHATEPKPNTGLQYARAFICGTGKKQTMHRFLLNAPAGVPVDHKDGDGLNNRRSNIRLATFAQNQHNKRREAGGTSMFKGVSFDRRANKWRASICFDGHSRYLGNFDEQQNAAMAYDAKAIELFGEFARLNFPIEATV